MLGADSAVRHALRLRPNDGASERARTLVAAARVERRSRASTALADVLAGGLRGGPQ